MRKAAIAGAAAGATLLGAAVIYYLQEKATPGPNYRVLTSNGDLEIRAYNGMVVAETIGWFLSPASTGVTGNLVRVCGQGFLGA